MARSTQPLTPFKRILVLTGLLLVCLILLAQQGGVFDGMFDGILEKFDHRPKMSILFLGNSRTSSNNLPQMVHDIANSANSPKNYVATMYAPDGATLESLWNDTNVQNLLLQKWDYVVIQGAGNEQITDFNNSTFLINGAKLANTARSHGATPVLLVAWRSADNFYPEIKDIGDQRFYGMIQSSYFDLASRTNAPLVNVGRVWEDISTPDSSLLSDGDNPATRGTYLAALMLYRFFSGDNLNRVSYAPFGVSDADALKEKAMH